MQYTVKNYSLRTLSIKVSFDIPIAVPFKILKLGFPVLSYLISCFFFPEMIFIECSFCHKDVRNSAKSMFDHKCFGVSNQYTCLVCNQKEQQAWKIKRHYLKHTQEKNFTCDYCNYKTAYVNDLKKHTRKHTGEKPYRCEICPYAAADSKSLRAHYKIHQKDSVKTLYFCSVCSKRYYNKEKLVEHFVLHDVNRHKCQVCEDSFENAWELELHLSELHHIIQVEESNKSEKEEEVLVSQKDDDDDHGKNDDKKDDAGALSLSSIF